MDRWSFEVPGVAVPKERPRAGRAGALTKAQRTERHAAKMRKETWVDPRAVVFRTPTRTTQYEMAVAAAAQQAGLMVRDRQCEVWLRVWLPPESTSMDLDNIVKSVLDGLVMAGKGALANDNVKIVRRIVAEYAGEDAVHPRTLVTVKLVHSTGLLHLAPTTVGIDWRPDEQGGV